MENKYFIKKKDSDPIKCILEVLKDFKGDCSEKNILSNKALLVTLINEKIKAIEKIIDKIPENNPLGNSFRESLVKLRNAREILKKMHSN